MVQAPIATNGPSSPEDQLVRLNISQYTFQDMGSSACTVIASSMLQYLLVELHRQSDVAFQQSLHPDRLANVISEGVAKFHTISGGRADIQHLAVDELGPAFFTDVKQSGLGFFQGLLTDATAFESLVHEAQSMAEPDKYIGIVITKPPESVMIIIPPANREGGHYIFFDSHSRPQDGLQGSYLIRSTSKDRIIRQLKHVFPAFDPSLLEGDAMGMMYNMFEGTIFQMK